MSSFLPRDIFFFLDWMTRRMKMRIGKLSTLIAQFNRPTSAQVKVAPLLSKSKTKLIPQQGQAESGSAASKVFKTIALFGAGASCTTTMAYADHDLGCPCYPWPHDQASTRRGLQLFQDTCSSCHSMSLVSYRNTEEETKAIAAEIQVLNDERIPLFYANQKAAARLSAYPPDLSLITKALLNINQNYVFSLLSGYRGNPAGVKIGGRLHYNPMPKMLIDRAVDGSPAAEAQIGKDVVTSLLGVLC